MSDDKPVGIQTVDSPEIGIHLNLMKPGWASVITRGGKATCNVVSFKLSMGEVSGMVAWRVDYHDDSIHDIVTEVWCGPHFLRWRDSKLTMHVLQGSNYVVEDVEIGDEWVVFDCGIDVAEFHKGDTVIVKGISDCELTLEHRCNGSVRNPSLRIPFELVIGKPILMERVSDES